MATKFVCPTCGTKKEVNSYESVWDDDEGMFVIDIECDECGIRMDKLLEPVILKNIKFINSSATLVGGDAHNSKY